jgi:hypothetical protein
MNCPRTMCTWRGSSRPATTTSETRPGQPSELARSFLLELALPRGRRGRHREALENNSKSASLQHQCYHELLPPAKLLELPLPCGLHCVWRRLSQWQKTAHRLPRRAKLALPFATGTQSNVRTSFNSDANGHQGRSVSGRFLPSQMQNVAYMSWTTNQQGATGGSG